MSRNAALLSLLDTALVLALAPAAGGSRSPPLSTAHRVPDWRIPYEEELPPLTVTQIVKALFDAEGGPRLEHLRVTSSPSDVGDRRLLSTISPNGDGVRDRAVVRFHLDQRITLTMTVMACSKHSKVVAVEKAELPPGNQKIVWAAPPKTAPRTYLLMLKARAADGRTRTYGNPDYRLAELNPAPVVRVQGVSAVFTERSYAPAAAARLRVTTDASTFSVQFFQAGPETQPTTGSEMQGVPVGPPRFFDWSSYRSAPGTIVVRLGDWPNGVYFAKLTASDGRVGFAPFVVRPKQYGHNRVAYIVHTNTWEAYNHQDVDGDGWGDTWYANSEARKADLLRPYIRLGAPPKWRNYDVTPLHWIYRTGKQVDFVGDDDLVRFTSARQLARLYDLIVFPGHEEYVTSRAYDLISGYRNLGGNLMFLSATNLLWRIDRHGNTLTRVAEWRQLGRPESRIVGVQYRGNDEGEHRGPYELTPYGRSSWAFAGVDPGKLLPWRWFGIEFDKTTSASPRRIHVLAQVNPHMRDRGLRGQMTYYERGGAKVFASGILSFPSAAYNSPYRQVLENVWARLSKP
jgi:N,N-dimethylformamidase beta subunit-like protein